MGRSIGPCYYPNERIIDARLVLICTNSTISVHHSSGGEDLLGDKKALVGLGVQAGKSIVSPAHYYYCYCYISSFTAPEEDKVIDRVMHDWQHRAISNSDPTAGVNEDVNSRNR